MTHKILFVYALLSTSFSLLGQTYITNVSVGDVERQRLLPNQTVVIDNNKIKDIKKSTKVKIPENAKVLDGSGKFLFPGLTDAHIHFFQNGGLYTRPDAIDLRKERPYHKEMAHALQNMEEVLLRYLQNGITNVIDVGATYNFLEKRDQFKGRADTPSVYMTGPLLTTYEPSAFKDLEKDAPFSLVRTREEAVKMVQEQLPYRPDFIKIWYIAARDGLAVEESARKNLPIIKAIINEAHSNNLKVAVHATQRITAQLAVESGADYLVHSVVDEEIADSFVQLLKKNNTILCPTLTVHLGYSNTFGQKEELGHEDLLKADPFQLGTLLDLKHLPDTLLVSSYKKRSNSQANKDRLDRRDRIMMANLKKLSDADVDIATGTDAGNIGTLHASSYWAELRAMSKNGMGNWQLIKASTLNGAKVLGKENEFGSIGVGKQANLILLNSNPIEDIENLMDLHTVINNGTVFNPDEILPDSPSHLAQRQLNGYNLRNIDAFLEPYADDVEVYTYPDKLRYKGKEIMRDRYSKMFQNTPNLHCELVARIAKGNIVIDQERVQFGNRIKEAVAIYHIENNKIKKVYFIK
ncbi:amidohydrolase [Arenibacter aquaticus]|uniref:Amidohydrolase n=1 Tax=Arenibacter aquaticus TaxID=2489054 RepID=A0A3S0AGR9_9FLAO|nr:amidohydrolase family protein [Arenibacter aquaticus]RTE55461.1 amidohydrolase [Arenibacter aquaticus]